MFSLSSQNFALFDNGVAQRVTVDDDINPAPLSIVVAIETGGFGQQEIASLGGVETMLEAIIGEQPHEIALVAFDRSAASDAGLHALYGSYGNCASTTAS